MRRLLLCCCISVALYLASFAFVLNRPLSLGMIRLEMQQKLARGARLPAPKIVILAGSNAPYSHSCRVIGAMLQMPCENAGIAVGFSLDDLFARWRPLLHRGDIVYLPMEIQQYDVTRTQNDLSVDSALLFRDHRALLWRLGPQRVLAGAFSNRLTDGLEAVIEMLAHGVGYGHRRAKLAAQFDRQGDRIGTTLLTADPQFLALLHRPEPSPAMISAGYGRQIIARFVRAEQAAGVTMIGGLPTDFDTVPLSATDIAIIQATYTKNGGAFLITANHSRYPPADFYDSEDHLAQPCQYLQSFIVARGLGRLTHRPVSAPTIAMQKRAETCPSYRTEIALVKPITH
jgi:hypothetical protein